MCTTGSPPLRRHRGFTLVEIIVVVVIISVMLTMTTISLSGAMAGVAAKESAGNLYAALRYAHDYAALHGCECRVKFSRSERTYELTYQPDPTKEDFQPMLAGSRTQLPDRVSFADLHILPRNDEATGDVILFEPTGEADAASIVLSDGRDSYSITVSPNTGMTKLQRGTGGEIASDREDLDA